MSTPKDYQPYNPDSEDTVTLNLENGDIECSIMASFPLNGKDYIALLPMELIDGIEENEILLYSYEWKDDDFSLSEITDEEEFDQVADAFDEMLDEAAFNDME